MAPLGRASSSRQLWEVAERWHLSDATALELIEFPGEPGKEGKRPRFRLTTRQRRLLSYLLEIETAFAMAGTDVAWLHRRIGAAPFARRSPIEHMTAHGMDGMADVLRALNRLAMRAALRG